MRAARSTWQLFRDDWLSIPRERRKRFAVTLTIGWVVAGALTLTLSLLGSAFYPASLEAWEAQWLRQVVDASPLQFDKAVFFESPGNGVVLLPLTLFLATLFARRRQPLWALSVLAACLMMAVVVGVGWITWDRSRPEFLYEGLPASSLSAFPSGHAAMSIPVYGFLTYLGIRSSGSRIEKGIAVLLLLAVLTLISLARVVLSAHWPSDLMVGWLLGTFWLGVVIVALRRGESRKSSASPVPSSAAIPAGSSSRAH